jgi:hypothetical protein
VADGGAARVCPGRRDRDYQRAQAQALTRVSLFWCLTSLLCHGVLTVPWLESHTNRNSQADVEQKTDPPPLLGCDTWCARPCPGSCRVSLQRSQL